MAENMIKFLRGNVANLPQTATEGAVYFTKDEGLYLGLADGSYHRYGDFITVADVASLPTDGAHETCMYYCVAENVLAKWDGAKWVQINKQKTLAELGGVAKSTYEAKIAALEAADTENATATSNLSTYVGTIPETAEATNIVAYVQEKTAGIASDAALSELAGKVATAEGDIDKLEASLAEGGATATAIANAKDAGDAAQADVDALELKVGAVADGKTVVGLISDAQTKADQGVTDAATAQAKADEAYNLANGKATMAEVNAAISGAGHAVKTEVDTAIANLDKDYKAADTTLETKLQGNIDKKVDQTAYDTKVAALEGEDARLAGLISAMDTAYKAADTALGERVAGLEADITGLSGAMHFKGVVNELPETTEGYADGDTIIVGNKEYVVNGEAFVELGDVSAEVQRITDLEGVVGKAAEGENAATGLVKSVADNAAAIAAEKVRAEAKEAELAGADATNLQAAKDYADGKIADLKIGDYAKQAALDTHTGNTTVHITADERTAWNAAEQNAKDYADGLKATIDGAYAAADAALKTELQGYADQAEADAISTAAGALASAKAELEGKVTAEANRATAAEAKALSDAQAYADGLKTTIDAAYVAADTALKTELQGYADTAETDAVNTANAYTDAALTWGSF